MSHVDYNEKEVSTATQQGRKQKETRTTAATKTTNQNRRQQKQQQKRQTAHTRNKDNLLVDEGCAQTPCNNNIQHTICEYEQQYRENRV